MAIKRKFDADLEDVSAYSQVAKHVKLVPFPSVDVDMDSVMSECYPVAPEPFYPPFQVHLRLSSNASTDSNDSSSNVSSPYPTFELYPVSSRASPVTATPPSSTLEFRHNRPDCTQIPKLRVACGAGPNAGHRSMWSMCEECGAIQMVDL